jgi:putative Mg2+ transporter-C (MgtC) family protein
VTDPSLAQDLLRLAAAVALGGTIGLERELRAQPAGFRTHVLVALGASLFTVSGIELGGADPSRVAAQVVAGIGFLGAGAILHERGAVHGLTTAASLWIAAAVGVACGAGVPELAAFAVVIALLTLIGLRYLENEYFPRRRGHRVVLDVTDATDLHALTAAVARLLEAPTTVVSLERAGPNRTTLTMTSPMHRGFSLVDLATRLRALDGVVGVELGG